MVIAWLLTAATLPLTRLGLTAAALLVSGVPFLAGGIAIGHSLSTKAALAVAQSLPLPLACRPAGHGPARALGMDRAHRHTGSLGLPA